MSFSRSWICKNFSRSLVALLVGTSFGLQNAAAVEKLDTSTTPATSTFNIDEPTSSDIPNWETGWNAPAGGGITGWDYIGQVNGASGTYLRNGWVLTAGHVGAGNFTLAGMTYTYDPATAQNVGGADLALFRLTVALSELPDLIIAANLPQPGTLVTMIGYGGGTKAWGYNTVTAYNQPAEYSTFVSADFETLFGTGIAGGAAYDNQYRLIGGDSGGGDFVYNMATAHWELVGNNEAVDDATMESSYMVQLNTYKSEIDLVTAVPEPSAYVLVGFGLAFIFVRAARRRARLV